MLLAADERSRDADLLHHLAQITGHGVKVLASTPNGYPEAISYTYPVPGVEHVGYLSGLGEPALASSAVVTSWARGQYAFTETADGWSLLGDDFTDFVRGPETTIVLNPGERAPTLPGKRGAVISGSSFGEPTKLAEYLHSLNDSPAIE